MYETVYTKSTLVATTHLAEYDDDDEQRPLVSSMSNLLQFEQQAVADEEAGTVSFITAVLLGIALCFHSLLEVRR